MSLSTLAVSENPTIYLVPPRNMSLSSKHGTAEIVKTLIQTLISTLRLLSAAGNLCVVCLLIYFLYLQ